LLIRSRSHYIEGMSPILARVACLLALAGLALPVVASAACYQLFDKKDRLVLQSTSPPVDLSRPTSDEVGRLYPGHYLIMGGSGPCPEVDELNRDNRTFKPPAEVLIRESVVAPSDYGDRPYTLPSRLGVGGYLGPGSYSGSGGGSYRSPPGTDVRVRSYTRDDGTVVRSHTRARPGSGSKR
jgi:hypothetical protein